MTRAAACLALTLATTAAAAGKPTVAILYFDYDGKSEEMALLKKGLAQMLISDLSGHPQVSVVERARLQDVLDELKLNQTSKVDPSTANKIGKLLGARYLVLGGYFDVMGRLRVDARVVETETGKVLRSAGSTGKPDEFLELEQKLSTEIGNILSAAAGPAGEKGETATATRPTTAPKKLSAKTAQRYGKALDALDRKDKAAAKKELEAVVAEQPDFVLASLDLAALAK